MKAIETIQLIYKKIAPPVFVTMFLCSFNLPATSQIISVYPIQNMNFGSFYPGSSGGTIIISTDATRSATGDVILLNQATPCVPAIFEIEAVPGTIVSITNGPDATLTGGNGGTMSLHIGNSNPGAPFITTIAPPGRTPVSIGATLSVGSSAASIPGAYSGTFSIIFNNQ